MRGRASIVVAVAAVLAVLPGPAARADFGVVPGSLELSVLDAAGQPESRAGAHPDRLRLAFELNLTPSGGADGNLRDLSIDLPPGLVGDPSAVAACARETFDLGPLEGEVCPDETAVGEGTVTLNGVGKASLPIYNVAPGPLRMAVLGMNPLVKLPLTMRLRATDFGVTIDLNDVPQTLAVVGVGMELWGIPADRQSGGPFPRRPFLTLPTRCGEPLAVGLRLGSWQEPGAWRTASVATEAPLTGCEGLGFSPRLDAALTDPVADSPSGAEIAVELPASDRPDGRAGSHLRGVRLQLPTGISISPAGLGGLREGARIGSVELSGSALPEALSGSILAGGALPGPRLGVVLAAHGHGVDLRLPGSIGIDPVSGGVSAELTDLPQVPLERIVLRFDGGTGALLATPPRCGPSQIEATFDPYSGGPSVRSVDAVAIGPHPGAGSCGAALPFAPSFEAGSAIARAGRPTGFSIVLRRRDGEAAIDRFSALLPAGLSAALGSVEPCAASAASLGSCAEASRIGSARVELGPGPSPAPLLGDVHLTGPHRGAPFGLAIGFRAALGPFDLGEVVVRAALRVDPRDGRVRIESDPLPQRVEGVPLRLRGLALEIDRPGLLRNPTSCEPAVVEATVAPTDGTLVRPASPFFVRGCERLGFRPRVSLALGERGEPLSGGHPSLRIAVRARRGDANLRGARFRLPGSLSLDPSGLGALCSRRAAANGNCPRGAAAGTAIARTPLLSGPLRGPVYAVQPHGEGLPDLWAAVRGDGIRLDVRGKTLRRDGRLSAALVGVPDLPLRSFALRIDGGPDGLLRLGSSPCGGAHPQPASAVDLEAHSEAFRILRVPLSRAACGEAGGG